MSSWQDNLSWYPFGSGFADVNCEGCYTLTWNKTTQELVDADDGEVMGKMVYRPMRGWVADCSGRALDDFSDSDDDDSRLDLLSDLSESEDEPTEPTVSVRRKARTPLETNTTRHLRSGLTVPQSRELTCESESSTRWVFYARPRELTFHGVDACDLAKPTSTMHKSLKEPGMFTEFLSVSQVRPWNGLVRAPVSGNRNKKWCTTDRENFCDNCVLVKNNPKTTIWKCLGH